MSGMYRSSGFVRGLLVGVLVLLSLLAAAPETTLAQPGCTVAKAAPAGGVPRWLEDCGHVSPRGNPELIARRALAGRAGLLGLRADGRDLALLAVKPTTAATHVRFAQIHKGVPVYLGQVLVQYAASGEVQLINNHTLPNLDVDVTPTIGAGAALALAQAQVRGSDKLRAPSSQELVIYGEGKQPELAWHITLPTSAPLADWHVMVSARSGAVLGIWDAIMYETGSGLVYDPNAVQQSGDTDLADNGDATSAALNNARVTLTLNNLSAGTGQLKGSYVDLTAPGVTGCSLPYTPGLADEPTRIYNYDRDDDRFEEANIYAAIDGTQSWFQSLGFTNVNNRAIPVDAHCIPDDNSYYSSDDTALHFGDGGVDDGEDADIVIHEYGHSVLGNQVPGWGPGDDTEQRAMGEGFGDFLAGMYYSDKGDQAYLNTYKYCIGEWDASSYNPVVGGNSGSGCVRWIDGRSEVDGSDIGAYSSTPIESHADGRFWSAALTCIYEGMGGNSTARDNVMKLVLQHHFSLTPDSSNDAFEDAVEALRLADVNLFAGANQTLIGHCALERELVEPVQLLPPTITAPAEAASINAGSQVAITWNTNGAPASATYTIEYAACNPTPSWTPLVTTTAGATSFNWTAPATPGSYCLRMRAQEPISITSDYSAIRTITVVKPNTAPSIVALGNRSVPEGTPVSFTISISDANTPLSSLTLAGSSSNTALVPNSGVSFSGSGASRTVKLTPKPSQFGTTTITITVGDGQASTNTSFVLTVVRQPKVYLPLLRRP